MSLRDIYESIAEELQLVEKTLRSSIECTTNPAASKIAEIVLTSPGKRIRPALALFCGKAIAADNGNATAQLDSKLIRIASAFELIHMASLVHDDVIDQSDLRHNKPTINSLWGEDASVAFGDFLYSLSAELTTSCKNLDLHACMSEATRAMCEGELLQVCERDNLDLSYNSYIEIIQKKTAGLFESSCEAGAVVYGASPEERKSLKNCGLQLGTAFQMIDDYLDLVAEEKILGKTPGQDVEVGKLTLPLIYLLEESDTTEKLAIKKLIMQANESEAFEKLKLKLFNSNAISKTADTISSHVLKAKRSFEFLGDSPYKKSLEELIQYILERALSYVGKGVNLPDGSQKSFAPTNT